MIIAGVEEAGRGPVIGPMVMAICGMEEEHLFKLKIIGAKDSKLLSPLQREKIFEKLKDECNFRIIILEPSEIDDALNDPAMNLNKLEAKTSATLINDLNPEKVTLDCPSNNISAYKNLVKSMIINKKTVVIAEHKADLNYEIVGAASILAKVTRDREIEKIKKKLKVDFGSGYPSDPKTIEFLNKNWDKYPEIFRKTWATYKKVADSKKQKGLNNYT